MSKGELVPQITLNALADPNDEWTLFEVGEILYRQFNQWFNLDLEHSGVSTLYTALYCRLEPNKEFVNSVERLHEYLQFRPLSIL